MGMFRTGPRPRHAQSNSWGTIAGVLAIAVVLACGVLVWVITRPGQEAAPAPTPSPIPTAPSPSAPSTAAGSPSSEPAPTPTLEPSPESSPSPSAPLSPSPSPSPVPTASTAAPTSCAGVAVGPPANPDFADTIAQRYGDQIAVSWVSEQGIQTVGGLAELPAWSTSKVPVSIAVARAGLESQFADSQRTAITVSDNDAAIRLWNALGDGDAARADAVTAVLRAAGDDDTTVPDEQRYPPFTVFGQTDWTTAAQVSFAQQLECLEGSARTVELMSEISSGQSWGIGRRPGAVFKGGWGPTRQGGYTVRQFGWFSDGDIRVPIAVAARAGSFEAGIAILDDVVASTGHR